MTGEQENVLLELGSMLMYNNKMEADAVKGYTEQLNLIRKAKEICSDLPEFMELLEINKVEIRNLQRAAGATCTR